MYLKTSDYNRRLPRSKCPSVNNTVYNFILLEIISFSRVTVKPMNLHDSETTVSRLEVEPYDDLSE